MKDEAAAKRAFRNAVETYSDLGTAFTWTVTDAFRSGLPDFFVAYAGRVIAVEAKFVRKLPAKASSQVLSHEVSQSQLQFMQHFNKSGNCSVVLIGLEDVFVYTRKVQENYSLQELLAMPRIEQDPVHGWDLDQFWRENLYGK